LGLSAGARLGPYEILAPLGAGGMGEVYRARDTRLERIVAIKVLPEHLSSSPEVRQRFEREARTISALSHPHICALYDVGNEQGVEYLVMEYLEGESLAQRLARGALPLEQTLRYGMEIADALDRAHRQGIVHRDLKPGNVMLTSSGVKLLDFGLAKALNPEGPVEDLTTAPTEAKDVTAEGTILGTLSYMAPEQLEGKKADTRTDIFALSTTLYEMAAGRKAFSGSSQASVISSIMASQPPAISTVAPTTPAALDRVVRIGLAKDANDRWQSAHDIGIELRWIAEGRSEERASDILGPRRARREWIAWIVAAAAAVAALALAMLRLAGERPVERRLQELQVLPPPGTTFALEEAPRISPDGRRLAFVAVDSAGKSLLYVRPLDSSNAQPLADTDGASMPFWSPDSRSLGFFASGKLRTVSIAGGRPQILCDAPVGRGGSWSRDGSIVFIPSPPDPPQIVAASGGPARQLFPMGPLLKDPRQSFPDFLPDSGHYVYLSILGKSRENRAAFVTSLDGKTRKQLAATIWSPVFAPPDTLLFRREDALMAQRFDTKSLEPVGAPSEVASDVGFNPITWQSLVSASENGILAYQSAKGAKTQFTWLDREGKVTGAVGPEGIHNSISLSPDGKKVAYDEADPRNGDVSVWLVGEQEAPLRFTFGSVGFFPVWSPDGNRVVYSSLRGPPQIYQKVTSGAGDEEPLLESMQAKIPSGFSPDGRFLVYSVLDSKTRFDIWVLPLFGDRKPFPFLQTEAGEMGGQISPNGRWMAYSSNESGSYEVYVRPFPPAPGKWQVSRDGGSQPRWRSDGKELFYLSTDRKLMAVDIKTDQPAFEAGIPSALFGTHVSNVEGSNPWSQYAATADGRHFLVNRLVAGAAPSPITVLVNWRAREKK
jgi:Tol biopolymer transport system component/predicted Ser/Thr protein kinase